MKAARTDARTLTAATREGTPVPAAVWERLRANATDPDYSEALYLRLGPEGTAALVKAAQGDPARIAAIRASMGVASHHMMMDASWLRAFLAEAGHRDVGPVAAAILTGADMSRRTSQAIAGLDLEPVSP